MKIIIEKLQADEEEQILVKCHSISPELLAVLNSLKSRDSLLIANIGNEIHRVAPSDIFYIETVDARTFLYGESKVYESKYKLYELEDMAMSDFLRISKSAIVNLSKINTLIPSISGRLEAVLANGERVVISRQYVSELKKSFGL